MKIYSVYDPEFKAYGQIIDGMDDVAAEIISVLKDHIIDTIYDAVHGIFHTVHDTVYHAIITYVVRSAIDGCITIIVFRLCSVVCVVIFHRGVVFIGAISCTVHSSSAAYGTKDRTSEYQRQKNASCFHH